MARRTVVLVVEDEVILRMAAADLVEEAGFEPIEAANADEAIGILEVRSDVRLVFTDIQMPGSMDGMKLAGHIRRRWPPIELIIVSAKHDVPVEDIPERGMFFAKPYKSDEVIGALKRLAG